MLTFLFILLPFSFVAYCFIKRDKQILIPSVIGLLFAILICAFRAFFSFTHRVIPYSFVQNLLYYISQNVILPVILCTVYFFVSKDDYEVRVRSFFPLICSYFIIYLPYTVISVNETSVYTGYSLFIKPIMILAMILQLNTDFRLLYEGIKEKYVFKCILNVALIIVYMLVPAILDSIYIMGYKFGFVILVFAIYLILPLIYHNVMMIKKIKKDKASAVNS